MTLNHTLVRFACLSLEPTVGVEEIKRFLLDVWLPPLDNPDNIDQCLKVVLDETENSVSGASAPVDAESNEYSSSPSQPSLAASIRQTSQGSRDRNIPAEGKFDCHTPPTILESNNAATHPRLLLPVRQPLVNNGKRGRTVPEFP
jgi:hypothetical protein